MPFTLLVNEEPALLCELLVTSPESPITLCGGIVGIHARHPSRPELRLSMALLAARRGETATTTPWDRAFEEPDRDGGQEIGGDRIR